MQDFLNDLSHPKQHRHLPYTFLYEETKKAPTPPTKLAKGGMPVRGSRTATNKTKKMMGGGYAMPAKTTMMSKGGAVKKAPAKKGK